MNRQREAMEQAKIVSHNLAQETWFSTQSTAFSLMAMGRLAEKLSGTLDFNWTLNGKQQPAVKSAKAIYEASLPTSPHEGKVILKNNGKGSLNADLITRTQLLNDTLPPMANNLRLNVRYLDNNGSPIDTRSLNQGTDFMAVVTVANISGTTDYTNLALTHIIPAGWEIFNERMAGQITTSAPYSYQDIRDDRILTYFNLQQGQAKTFLNQRIFPPPHKGGGGRNISKVGGRFLSSSYFSYTYFVFPGNYSPLPILLSWSTVMGNFSVPVSPRMDNGVSLRATTHRKK